MVELMSNRVAGQALRVAAFAGLALGSVSLAGCSTLGLGGGDVTGSTGSYAASSGPQSMPKIVPRRAAPSAASERSNAAAGAGQFMSYWVTPTKSNAW